MFIPSLISPNLISLAQDIWANYGVSAEWDFAVSEAYEGNGTTTSTFQLNATVMRSSSESGSALDPGDAKMTQVTYRERDVNNYKVLQMLWKMHMYITVNIQRQENS